MVLSPKSLILFPLAATNFFVALVRSSFTLTNISAGMTCPAAPVSTVALMFTQVSLTSMTFLGAAQEFFQHSATTQGQISSTSIWISEDFLPLLFLALLQQTPRMQLIFVFVHFYADVSFVFVCSVQTPVPTPLGSICRKVCCFPTAPANSGVFAGQACSLSRQQRTG